jgi:hypothetical protein
MKDQQLKCLITALAAIGLITLIPACATQKSDARSEVEMALTSSGFKVKPATTPEQHEQLQKLPDNQFAKVKQGGHTYYLYADKRNKRLYCGSEEAYRAYQRYVKIKRLRQEGVYVDELKPSDVIVMKFHGWEPFPW